MKTAFPGGSHSLVEIVAAGAANMTPDEYDRIVKNWIATAKHSRTGRLYSEMVSQPMLELLAYRNGTYEGYFGVRGLKRLGLKEWREHVTLVVNRLISALQLDDVVLGGGNAKNLDTLPPGCRVGNNAYAFIGGFRMWETGPTKPAHGRRPSKGPSGKTSADLRCSP